MQFWKRTLSLLKTRTIRFFFKFSIYKDKFMKINCFKNVFFGNISNWLYFLGTGLILTMLIKFDQPVPALVLVSLFLFVGVLKALRQFEVSFTPEPTPALGPTPEPAPGPAPAALDVGATNHGFSHC